MDIMDLRVIITLISFIAFLGIVFWAYGSRQKPRFDEAAMLPFADDAMQERTLSEETGEPVKMSRQSVKGQSADSTSEVLNG
jgi:cytochrome c oxidase cbb3-type subunit 4